MKYFAICKLKNGEFECISVHRFNVSLKYKEIVNNVIKQLENDNRTRKEHYKIIEFVDLVEHGNGFNTHDHLVWAKSCCEAAKQVAYPIYDFIHPENGVTYY